MISLDQARNHLLNNIRGGCGFSHATGAVGVGLALNCRTLPSVERERWVALRNKVSGLLPVDRRRIGPVWARQLREAQVHLRGLPSDYETLLELP